MGLEGFPWSSLLAETFFPWYLVGEILGKRGLVWRGFPGVFNLLVTKIQDYNDHVQD